MKGLVRTAMAGGSRCSNLRGNHQTCHHGERRMKPLVHKGLAACSGGPRVAHVHGHHLQSHVVPLGQGHGSH